MLCAEINIIDIICLSSVCDVQRILLISVLCVQLCIYPLSNSSMCIFPYLSEIYLKSKMVY